MNDDQNALTLPKSADEVDSLIVMAERAERAIEAVKKIKRIALAVTNKQDWVDENGKPYMQSSGAEKIGPLFGISWLIDPEPAREVETDGHYSYNYRGTFSHSVNGKERSITAIGSRSSKDDFFRVRYRNNERVELPANEVDKESVKQAAHTNCLVNGITRILGIRNLTWEEVEQYTGFKRSDCGKVAFQQQADPNAAIKLPNYGDYKGLPLDDPSIPVGWLKRYLDGAEKSIANPQYARNKQNNERLRDALKVEIEKRETAAKSEPIVIDLLMEKINSCTSKTGLTDLEQLVESRKAEFSKDDYTGFQHLLKEAKERIAGKK